jgi:hypothetical protein
MMLAHRRSRGKAVAQKLAQRVQRRCGVSVFQGGQGHRTSLRSFGCLGLAALE